MNSTSINIFQKNWAFTTSDSEKSQIKTGSFGPCYVVTFTSGKFAAMAHIDDTTIVDSISDVFNKFIESNVNLKDVKVIILGGWKQHQESYKWGQKIVKKIQDAGFENVSTKNMYSKKIITTFQSIYGVPKSEVKNHYHIGALVDSRNGTTFLLKEYPPSLEEEQARQYSSFSEMEVPLTQVTN